MGVGILVPVPAVHLKSALTTCKQMGRVAFGSNDTKLFERASEEYGEGLPLLIYPTQQPPDSEKLSDPGFISFRGSYVGTISAVDGKHPKQSNRPSSTVEESSADAEWEMFWEIADLRYLAKIDQIATTNLNSERTGKPLSPAFVPRGPILVKASFL